MAAAKVSMQEYPVRFFQVLILAWLVLVLSSSSPSRVHENLILISLDTVRSDFIDTGPGARAATPCLKKLASRSVVFENAFVPIPQTLPSHISVLTGLSPAVHGVRANDHCYTLPLRLLQEELRDRGWQTSAVVSLGVLAKGTGVERGFNTFRDDLFPARHFFVPASRISDLAINMLEETSARPRFFFLHYSDPHTPYAPPQLQNRLTILLDGKQQIRCNAYRGAILRYKTAIERGHHRLTFRLENPSSDFNFFIIRRLKLGPKSTVLASDLQYSKDYYGGAHLFVPPQGEIRFENPVDENLSMFQIIPILSKRAALKAYRLEIEYLDRELGRLFDFLESRNLWQRTTMIIFADHGEGLGERDGYFGHVRFLNRQFIQSPLILHIPGVPPRRVNHPVSTTGIKRTVKDILGIPSRSDSAEPGFLQLAKGREQTSGDISAYAFKPSARRDKFTFIRWPYQMIVTLGQDNRVKREYYDLLHSSAFSPAQAIPSLLFSSTHPRLHNLFMHRFRQFRSSLIRQSGSSQMPEEHRRKLRSLGYLN